MLLFSDILVTDVQPGTLILPKEQKKKKKIQIRQNKSIRLDKMHHISEENFRSINWLSTSKRVNECINTVTFKFVKNTCPCYLKETFEFGPHCRIDAINKHEKLKVPFC